MSFHITKLIVKGAGLKPAELQFFPGFNIIDGPSNTGKSYVHQCLNYMTGGQDLPEEITEALGYTDVYLEIVDNSGIPHCFKRSLKGGNFLYAKTPFENFENTKHQVLKKKHYKENENTLSWYLLNLCGFNNAYLKKNRFNSKRSLSFRDIAHLFIIDEVKILTKASPIAEKRRPTTEEMSVFSYLLTGLDYKDLVEKEKPEIRKSKIHAQIDLIDSLLKTQGEGQTVNLLEESPNPERLQRVKDSIKSLLLEIETKTNHRIESENLRKSIWEKLQKVDSEKLVEEEIAKRFALLAEQYDKDLNRLEFLDEGNEFLSFLATVKCPLCGRTEEHAHSDIDTSRISVGDVTHALAAEQKKIIAKRVDLTQTIYEINLSIQTKKEQYQRLQNEIFDIESKIDQVLEPSIRFQKDQIVSLITEQNAIVVADSSNKMFGLMEKRNKLIEQLKQNDGYEGEGEIGPLLLKGFTDSIAELLKKWKYSEAPQVYFDNKKKDVNIDGHSRSSDGKGYRAITYSAFIIGLMKYCKKNSLKHSGVVILDSPLTAYKKKDFLKEDEISVDMENAFFEDLCKTPKTQQIIVLDNKKLSEELQEHAHYIHFTKDPDSGRYGFFPLKR